MARITVEDCLDKVDNRFELVMVSSKRARQIQIGGKDAMVSVDNDKPTVLALREIAEGLVDAKILIEKPSVEMDEEREEKALAAAAAELEGDPVINETVSEEESAEQETASEDEH